MEALGWLGIEAARSHRPKEAYAFREELLKESRQPHADLTRPPLPRELERGKQAFSIQIEGEAALAEGRLEAAAARFREVVRLVPPQGTIFDTGLQPELFFAANQSLARALEEQGQWAEAVKAYEDILAHKVLTVRVPGASEIYVEALGSISQALEKCGESAKAAEYRRQFRELRPAGAS